VWHPPQVKVTVRSRICRCGAQSFGTGPRGSYVAPRAHLGASLLASVGHDMTSSVWARMMKQEQLVRQRPLPSGGAIAAFAWGGGTDEREYPAKHVPSATAELTYRCRSVQGAPCFSPHSVRTDCGAQWVPSEWPRRVPKLRIRGASTPLPHTPSWR
jgi:hypothetical protein